MSDGLSKIPQLLQDMKKKQRRVSDIALDGDIFLGLDTIQSIDQKFQIYSNASAKSSYLHSPNYNRCLSINQKSLVSKISFQIPESGRVDTSNAYQRVEKKTSIAVAEDQQHQRNQTPLQSPTQFARYLTQTKSQSKSTHQMITIPSQQLTRESAYAIQEQLKPAKSPSKKRNSIAANVSTPTNRHQSLGNLLLAKQQQQDNNYSTTRENKSNQSANTRLISDFQKQTSIAVNSSHSIKKERKQEQEKQKTDYSSYNLKSKLNIVDMVTYKRNLQIGRSISQLKQSLQELGSIVADHHRPKEFDSQANQCLNNLAVFIYDFITSTNVVSRNFQPTPIPNLEKIFSQFNIDKKKLISLQTIEEKEDYIVSSMYNQGIDQLKSMVDKINKKTEEFEDLDDKEIDKGKYHKGINELFSWINIPCSYEGLKKRVKYSLVEVLYGHDNLQKLKEKNDQFNEDQKILNNNSANNNKQRLSTLGEFAENQKTDSYQGNYQGTFQGYSQGTFQGNVPGTHIMSFKKIRSVHLKYGEEDLPSGLQSMPVVDKLKQTLPTGSSQSSVKQSRTESTDLQNKVKSPRNLLPSDPTSEIQNYDSQQFADTDILLKQKLQHFQWDNKYERTFQSYKKMAKKAFVGLDSMNKWQSIGMQPIIHQLGLEEKLDLYREQLLDRYQNGEILKESEKIFIINTSQLLISNIDKEYFQGMLDFICEEDIQRLEEKIAENIILKYETIAKILKFQRNEYLREKSNSTHEKLQNSNVRNIYDKLRDENQFQARKRDLHLHISKIRNLLDRKFDTIQFYEKLRKNPYVIHFINQLKKAIAYKDLGRKKFEVEQPYYKNFAKRNHPPKKEKPLYSIQNGSEEIPVTSSVSQKLFHPSSRLLLGLNELARIEENVKNGRNRNQLTEMPPKQQKQLEMQRGTNEQFVNRLKDSIKLGNSQHKFAEYYSNGPIDIRDYQSKNIPSNKVKDHTADPNQLDMKLKKPHQWITQEIEEKSAIIIQKWTRRYLVMKKYKEIQEELKEKQEKKMFVILKKWKDSKELMGFIKDHTLKIARQKKMQSQYKSQYKPQKPLSQPNSPRSNNSTINNTNTNLNPTDSGKEKTERVSSSYQRRHKKQQSEYMISQAIHTLDNKERSDSISSINSKQSKHSYLGSLTSTKVGGTITHDISNYGLHPHNLVKKKSFRSTDDSIYQLSHGRSVSDFQSPRATLFQSKPILPTSAVLSNQFMDGLHNHQNVKEQIEEDVKMENEHYPRDLKANHDQNLQQQQVQPRKVPIQLERKMSVTANQLKYQIYKMKDGVRDFSRKREELFLKHKKLFYAAKQSSLQAVKNSGFIYYPHDVNSLDDKGNSPLYYVTKRGEEDFISFLLRLEADVNQRCSEGNTPLHIAFQLGREKVIIEFLDKGGDLNRVNNNGQTPLAFASINLLKIIGLERGITNVEPQKIGQRIDFDNNLIFFETHNVIDTSNHVKELNSQVTIVKKRKEKRPDEEMAQQEMYFSYIPTASTIDQKNYDRFSQGIKVHQNAQRTGEPITKVQCYIEPNQRQKIRQNSTSFLDFSSKLD